jgi:pimeloyl-ACP methyl ester carboxylesterase
MKRTLDTTLEGDSGKPAFVPMHFLGGSTREWDEVVELLKDEFQFLRLDLPGFGASSDIPGYTVQEMADCVQEAIAAAGLKRYVLVGHSMSGKVAMVLARRLADASDDSLQGLVLVAPSPPGPEPMGDDKRAMMLRLLGTGMRLDDADGRDARTRARAYITKNELRDIPPAVEERASLEVLKMNPAAWTAWVESGSREDWAERVGILDLPALVIAGEKDLSLGPRQQAEHTLPHLRQGRLEVVPNCSHLVPMECPAAMAGYLRGFVQRLDDEANVPAEYLDFIASERVSPKTREVLEARMRTPPVGEGVLSARQFATLSAILDRVIPQEEPKLDLAAYVLERLTTGKGDGWRYDVLPSDAQAYRQALDRLEGFSLLDADSQDSALRELAALPGTPGARWFEELRSDAVVAWMAHPATMARIGYSGIGVGGADTKYKGYVTIGPNEREAWEPEPVARTK